MKRSIVPFVVVLCSLSLSVSAAEPPRTYAVAWGAKAVVRADFNGDGLPDLAVACYGTISVLLGCGDGTFQSALSSPSNAESEFLAVADFDGDEDADLATLNAILLGNGDGTFGSPSFELDWKGGAIGDLNGDGNADLAGVGAFDCDGESSCYGTVTVRLGNGDGTFASAWTSEYLLMASSGPVVLADFDGDGNLDAATPAGLLLGNGDGTLQSPLPCYGSSGVADFNRDGKADLLGSGAVMLGNGDGTFHSPLDGGASSAGIPVLADLNGDGEIDASWAYDLEAVVFLGNGDGTLKPAIGIPTGQRGEGLVGGDFDGDGMPDLAKTAYNGVVSVLRNDGNWPALDAPLISVADTSATEGDAGTSAVAFTVSLTAPYGRPVTVAWVTADVTAAASADYQAAAGTLTIPAGQTSGTVTVLVNCDRLVEGNEYFSLRLLAATDAFVADGWGLATIVDDEPGISVGWVSKAEGKLRQTTPFPFVVTLSRAYDQAVSVSFRTAGWGSADLSDYVATAGSLTFNPGERTKTITINVIGDNKKEPNETFVVELFGPSGNASLTNAYGSGAIVNDD